MNLSKKGNHMDQCEYKVRRALEDFSILKKKVLEMLTIT